MVASLVQLTSDPSWRLLLPTIVQTVRSLVSIFVGVAIAVWPFRRNRQSEQEQWIRNQKAAHEQWARDQCKLEWQNILSRVIAIEVDIPIIDSGIPEHCRLGSMVLEVVPVLGNTIFIFPTLASSGFFDKWVEFSRYVEGQFKAMIGTNISVQKGHIPEAATIEHKSSG
jgi:hypothetical protein